MKKGGNGLYHYESFTSWVPKITNIVEDDILIENDCDENAGYIEVCHSQLIWLKSSYHQA